jgi:hypothetical protein
VSRSAASPMDRSAIGLGRPSPSGAACPSEGGVLAELRYDLLLCVQACRVMTNVGTRLARASAIHSESTPRARVQATAAGETGPFALVDVRARRGPMRQTSPVFDSSTKADHSRYWLFVHSRWLRQRRDAGEPRRRLLDPPHARRGGAVAGAEQVGTRQVSDGTARAIRVGGGSGRGIDRAVADPE